MGVIFVAVGSPDGIGVDEGPGDHEHRVLFQQVRVCDEGVADDPARGGGLGAVAEEFAVGGEEERTAGFEGRDVDFVFCFPILGGCCFHHGADFGAYGRQERGVRVDG